MDEDGLPIVGSGIDLTKVPAIQQKRIVAFLNQFIVHTVRFLNRFSTVCEEKLASVSLRIQQIETTLNILEAKLSSIPGLEDVRVERSAQRQVSEPNGPVSTPVQAPSSAVPAPTEPQQRPAEAAEQPRSGAAGDDVLTVAKDPRYARYLKMVQVGVPVMAIKNKMVSEGLDPSLLDTPDAAMPDAGAPGAGEEDDGSSGSESSFSD
ncbi:WASH complex subunit 3 [Lepisosteus oculatus]|uniref:WASH complex subunit 3 n=1 Tax=Lepisosteus oculatus TaxID=7918 RepID=UPI003720E25F